MAHLTARAARRQADAPALIDERGQCSWAELDARVNRLIRVLRAAGLQPGERIALFAGNRREVFELMAAAVHCGLFYVPVNWHFSVAELAHVLQDSGAVGLLTDSQFAATAAAALQQVPAAGARLRACIALEPGTSAQDCAGFSDFEALLATEHDASEPADQQAGGPMFYTSGTTGRPKGVLKNNGALQPIAALEAAADNLVASLQLPPQGITLLCGPYYHSAQYAWSFQPLLAGLSLVMCQRFDAAHTLQLIDQHGITQVHLVPTQFIRLLRLDEATKAAFNGRSLRRVWHGAAPCSPQIKREMIDWWGPCIHEYYGSTEGGVISGIGAEEWLARPASVGRATFQTEVQILRDDGSPSAAGEPGTIYLRNRGGAALSYHNDAAKTAAAHHGDGLFTTGDVGWLDDQGYLYLTDRKIDMIISGGVNIYPAEIEQLLAAHPRVQDVAVIGVPNAEFGEEVKAIVQPVPGQAPDEALREALVALCRSELAGYKLPRSIEFRSEMPRTETGKLQKRLLREPYWQGLERRI
ncbi:MAG: AMP-binding protein [Burkholderiaceae bacterium]|nr:AMP-binding protein [Burkholderiaceae bacterium]